MIKVSCGRKEGRRKDERNLVSKKTVEQKMSEQRRK